MQLSFGTLVTATIIMAIVIIVLYMIFYMYRINKQLRDDTRKSCKLPSPLTFLIVTVIVMLVAVTGSALNMASGYEVKVPEEYMVATYEYRDYNPNQMTGCRSLYSLDENPGYSKTVEQKGDIKFSVFTRTDSFDIFHPSFIIYAEYTGINDILYRGVLGSFYMPDGILIRGPKGNAGYAYEDYICIIGSATVQSTFELSIYLYDADTFSKSEDMSEYAEAWETIMIQVPQAN